MRQHAYPLKLGRGPGTGNKHFAECISHAAEMSNIDPYKATDVITYFLAAITEQVTQNKTVTLAGFGRFKPAKTRIKPDKPAHTFPWFEASMNFREMLRRHLSPDLVPDPPEDGSSYSRQQRRRIRHRSKTPPVVTAVVMEDTRRQAAIQALKLGLQRRIPGEKRR